MFVSAFRNGICRQSNQIVQHSVIGNSYPEGGFPLRLSGCSQDRRHRPQGLLNTKSRNIRPLFGPISGPWPSWDSRQPCDGGLPFKIHSLGTPNTTLKHACLRNDLQDPPLGPKLDPRWAKRPPKLRKT